MSPLGPLNYLGGGSSAPQIPSSVATQTYVTSLPIQAGQTIGVQNTNDTDAIGFLAGGNYAYYVPPLAEGASGPAIGPFSGQFTFNADVLPPPGVATAGPTSGSILGGTPVVIAGHDFVDVSAVKFGDLPAQSFAVASENAITAIAPQSTKRGPVTISVTTPAGTATAAAQFSYTACVVPNVAGRKLKGAKKGLRKAGCGVGKVKFLRGATAKTGRVTKQNPKAGKVLAPGVKVNIKLAP